MNADNYVIFQEQLLSMSSFINKITFQNSLMHSSSTSVEHFHVEIFSCTNCNLDRLFTLCYRLFKKE